MRIAHNDLAMVSAFMTAQSEAEAAFGSPDVYMEKYIEHPRHVEVQILADSKGNMIHLGERDCTVQRRHQKLVEESPSPAISADIRKKICRMALKIAQEAGYVNAGTVEFLVDSEGKFYFIEMNTRVQVEHTVTEMVTGVDIVKEQLRIAFGEKLSVEQKGVRRKGAAIECRINAEDPDRGFVPQSGHVRLYIPPGGPNVRVDSHLYSGYTIPSFYDSLLAKIIAHGKDREEAISTMRRALDELSPARPPRKRACGSLTSKKPSDLSTSDSVVMSPPPWWPCPLWPCWPLAYCRCTSWGWPRFAHLLSLTCAPGARSMTPASWRQPLLCWALPAF